MRPRDWIRAGVLGGIVTIFLALVGLIGNFTELNIVGEEITFALLALFAAPFVAGYAATRPRVEAGERIELDRRQTIVAGVVGGACAGLVFGAAVIFTDAFGVARIRSVFLNVTEGLVEFVTFGLPPVAGTLLMIAIAAGVGGLGAGLRITPARIRKPVTAAASSILVLGFLQRIVPITLDQLDLEREWLYDRSTGGLTWFGAAVVAAVAAALSVVKAKWWADVRARLFPPPGSDEADEGVAPLRLILLVVVAGCLFAIPWVVGEVISQLLGTVLIYVLLGIGLNIVVGYAGLLDLGYVFFFAVGAYATALLTGAQLNTFTGSAHRRCRPT